MFAEKAVYSAGQRLVDGRPASGLGVASCWWAAAAGYVGWLRP